MSWHVSPWVYPVWDSLCLLDLIISFSMLGKFSTIISSKILIPFIFLFFFWDPYIQKLVRLILSQRSLRLSSVLFILFTLFCSSEDISIILSSSSLIRSSASDILLLIPPHSSTLAWKIPWAEKPGRLQSVGSQRVGHD